MNINLNTIKNNKNLSQKKIYVGMSGGVDSSIVLVLLKEAGLNVEGFYLECWDSSFKYCKSDQDFSDALKVASKYAVKLNKIDLKDEYKRTVLDPFINEYKAGNTPNPDILCNKEIKFGLLFDRLRKSNDDFIVATGHYANISKLTSEEMLKFEIDTDDKLVKKDDILTISQGKDSKKDQSYFLYRILENTDLSKIIFPLGGLKKEDVRKMAEKVDLPVKNKPDSQGICFIGDVKLRDFLSEYLKTKTGAVCLLDGTLIGEHDGIHLYTIGQRHGFKLNEYQGKAMYIIKKDASTNTIYVGEREQALSNTFQISDIVSIFPPEKFNSISDYNKLSIRVRNLGEKYPIQNFKYSDSKLEIQTSEKIFGLASGQSGVVYYGDKIIAGGEIQ